MATKIKLRKFKGHFISDIAPKIGDTVICTQRKNFNYGLTSVVKNLIIDTKNWKVIIPPKKTYTLWITIEEHIENPDGTEKYRDMSEEDTRSVGRFSNLEDAIEQMDTLGNNHMTDGDIEL